MSVVLLFFFFFNDTATTEIYTLSLHDALPISWDRHPFRPVFIGGNSLGNAFRQTSFPRRSEEHTSELQSHLNLVCRLLLEKKKNEVTPIRSETHTGHACLRHTARLHSSSVWSP